MVNYVNPYTGEVVESDTPPRFRKRFSMLDEKSRLIPDPRPVATAIAFAPDVMPEQQVQAMLQRAYDDQRAKMKAAYEQGIDFYPVDEDVDDELEWIEGEDVDGFVSPHELVDDSDLGTSVTRGLRGMFKRPEMPTEAPLAPVAPKVAKGGKGKQAEPAKGLGYNRVVNEFDSGSKDDDCESSD